MSHQAKLKEDKGLVKIFECVISGFEIGKQVEKQLQELQQNAHLKGFRKGKAPMNVIQDGYFGKVYFELVNKEANKVIMQIAEENNFQLASSPKVELDAESSLPADRNIANIKDVMITITYEVFPEIPQFDFSKISVEKIVANVTDEDLSEELSRLARNLSTNEPKEEGSSVEIGDVVVIDAIGYEQGIAFDGGKLDNHHLEIGSKSFIEGFEEGIVGAKKGEERTLQLKFPEPYHMDSLAGKPVEFNVIVNDILKSTPATLDDDLSQKYGFETLDLLKEDIKKSIVTNYENALKIRKKDEIFKQIKEILNFEVPTSIIERTGDNSEDSIKDARLSVFLMQYAKQNNINISTEDFTAYVESVAKMYGHTPQSLLAFYNKNEQMKESTMNSLFENKIYEVIFDAIPAIPKVLSKLEIDAILKPQEEVVAEA